MKKNDLNKERRGNIPQLKLLQMNKSRHRNIMKNQGITNPLMIVSIENDLEEHPDKEFKGSNVSMFKQLKEVMNIL